jgi:uncharacterized protein (TIGR03067 family)
MRLCALLVVFAAVGWTLTAAEPSDEARKDLEKLQGTWLRVSGETDGKAVPEATLKEQKLTIKGDKYTLVTGKETREGTIKLDPAKSPRAIDLMPTEGPNKGKTLQGIYELDGDTFKYCLALPGKDRPTKFTSEAGSGHLLFTNKREK